MRNVIHREVEPSGDVSACKRKRPARIVFDVMIGESFAGMISLQSVDGVICIEDAIDEARRKLPKVAGFESQLIFFPVANGKVTVSKPI